MADGLGEKTTPPELSCQLQIQLALLSGGAWQTVVALGVHWSAQNSRGFGITSDGARMPPIVSRGLMVEGQLRDAIGDILGSGLENARLHTELLTASQRAEEAARVRLARETAAREEAEARVSGWVCS